MTDDIWTMSEASLHASGGDPHSRGLQIEKLHGVKPLDAQIGVGPKRTVPHDLKTMLFDPPPVLRAGQETDRGVTAGLHVYAILDAARVPNLSDLLARSGLEHLCLFQGKAFDDLGDAAPWIVRLEARNTFTRNLFTQSKAPWHLWPHGSFFVRAEADLPAVWRRFRRFVRMRDSAGNWAYFRFWDGGMFPHYIAAIQGSPEKLESWFGRIGYGQPQIVAIQRDTAWRFTKPALTGAVKPAAPILDDSERQALKRYRLDGYFRRLAQHLDTEFPAFAELSEAQRLQWLGTVYRIASDHGITSEAGIARLAEASLHQGNMHFDTNPILRGILNSHHSARDRSEMVLAQTVQKGK